MNRSSSSENRETTQLLMPAAAQSNGKDRYDVFPEFLTPDASIEVGMSALVSAIGSARVVAIDGVASVDWSSFMEGLDQAWMKCGTRMKGIDARERMFSSERIDELIAPYLSGDDPLFGQRCDLTIEAFFEEVGQSVCAGSQGGDHNEVQVWFGPGAAVVAPMDALLLFVDLPKNEEQFRARAGASHNLGSVEPSAPKAMYKRAYFVDWPVLKNHKATLLDRLDIYVDSQATSEPRFIDGESLRRSLEQMSTTVFRPRPWFEPGPWGGQWLLPLAKDACEGEPPNLAWSFELIAPENGVVLSDGINRCEVSLDWLLVGYGPQLLGFGHGFFWRRISD